MYYIIHEQFTPGLVYLPIPNTELSCITLLTVPIIRMHIHCNIMIINLFIQRKAGYIKRVAEILLKDYDSDIPSTFDELVCI